MIYWTHSVEEKLQEVLREAIPQEQWTFAPIPDLSEPEVPQALRDASILVGWGSNLDERVLRTMGHLRWIHSVSAGVDTLSLPYLRQRGIVLSNSRGIHAKPIAEQILGMMLSFSRQLHHYWSNQQAKHWERQFSVDELSGKTLLILGAGSIGLELALKAQAFDMDVIGVKTQKELLPHFDKILTIDEVDDVLPNVDYLVVLLPLTDKTRHFLDGRRLSLLKSSAVVINFGRGPVVDQEALVQALMTHQIRGAGLDVFEDEPLSKESPLWAMEDVLITPHTGGFTPHYNQRLVNVFLANFKAFEAGQPLVTRVNLHEGY